MWGEVWKGGGRARARQNGGKIISDLPKDIVSILIHCWILECLNSGGWKVNH